MADLIRSSSATLANWGRLLAWYRNRATHPPGLFSALRGVTRLRAGSTHDPIGTASIGPSNTELRPVKALAAETTTAWPSSRPAARKSTTQPYIRWAQRQAHAGTRGLCPRRETGRFAQTATAVPEPVAVVGLATYRAPSCCQPVVCGDLGREVFRVGWGGCSVGFAGPGSG